MGAGCVDPDPELTPTVRVLGDSCVLCPYCTLRRGDHGATALQPVTASINQVTDGGSLGTRRHSKPLEGTAGPQKGGVLPSLIHISPPLPFLMFLCPPDTPFCPLSLKYLCYHSGSRPGWILALVASGQWLPDRPTRYPGSQLGAEMGWGPSPAVEEGAAVS